MGVRTHVLGHEDLYSCVRILRPCHGGPYSCARPRGPVLVCQCIAYHVVFIC
jgi:hypothetical protein